MADKFQYSLNLGGLYTARPEDKIPERNATVSENIDFSLSGMIQAKKGYEISGDKTTEAGEGESIFLFKKNYGTFLNVRVRVIDNGTKRVAQWFNPNNDVTGKWELLIDNLTTAKKMGYAIANGNNGEKVNLLVMGDTIMNFTTWNGATATIASVTASTIVANETLSTAGSQEGFLTTNNALGDSTTQFDITNPSGTIFRYTWDTTGTDPGITTTTVPTGSIIHISADDFTAANNGIFEVTASASNYFEVTNASGVAEVNKTIGGSGFINAKANSLLVDGTLYAYTGISAKTFSGVSPDPTTQNPSAKVGITQKPDDYSYSTNPKGNIMATQGRKLFLTGVPDNETKVHHTNSNDITDFTVATGLAGGGTFDVIEGGGRITALEAKGKNSVIIHKDDAVIQYSRAVSDGTNVVESFDTLSEADDSGATNQKALTKINQASYFVSSIEGLKSLVKSLNDDSFNVDGATEIILPSIKDYDFSNSSAVYFPEKRAIYTSVLDEDSNRKTIAYYLRTGDISIDDDPGMDHIVDDKKLYFISALDQNTYEVFARNSKNGGSRVHRYVTKAFTFNDPAQGKQFHKLYIDGFIKSRTKIKVTILYGAFGVESDKSQVIAWDDDFVSSQKVSALGDNIIGSLPTGTSSDILDSFYFSTPLHFDIHKSTRYKIMFETFYDSTTDAESYWAIMNIGTNPDIKTIDYNNVTNTN